MDERIAAAHSVESSRVWPKLARGIILCTGEPRPFGALIIVGMARSIQTLIMPKQLYYFEETTLSPCCCCCCCCAPSVRPAGMECLQKPKLMSIFTYTKYPRIPSLRVRNVHCSAHSCELCAVLLSVHTRRRLYLSLTLFAGSQALHNLNRIVNFNISIFFVVKHAFQWQYARRGKINTLHECQSAIDVTGPLASPRGCVCVRARSGVVCSNCR